MKLAFFSNNPFTNVWFYLTYDSETDKFNKREFSSLETVKELDLLEPDHIYIKTSRVQGSGVRFTEVMFYRDVIRGLIFSQRDFPVLLTYDDFKEVTKEVWGSEKVSYPHCCAYYLLRMSEYELKKPRIVEKVKFGKKVKVIQRKREPYPREKYFDKFSDEELL